ncbi:phage tail tube protein [Thiohalocapsa marina]|uniref:phage tail tube protein n=1 Tax=Thiohalocapsa marina TaxID=424902 RepID=UPI0036DE81A6
MTQLLSRKTVILAKTETTYGTDSVPTGAANAMTVRNLSLSPLVVNRVSRDIVRPYLGNSEQLAASESVQLSFEVEVAGAGAAGTVPKWGPLMRACGMSETVSSGVSVTYQPVSASFDAVSIYFNLDGRRHRLLGARGTVSLQMAIDEIPVFAFQFTGLYAAPTDSAESGVAYTGWQVPVVVTNTNTTQLSFHGYTGALMSELSIELANEVQFRPVVGAANAVLITNRAPAGSITLDADLVAQWNPWTRISGGTLAALSVTQGIVAGNRVKIDAPKVQIGNPTMGDRLGIATEQYPLTLMPNAGNDELVITVS